MRTKTLYLLDSYITERLGRIINYSDKPDVTTEQLQQIKKNAKEIQQHLKNNLKIKNKK